MANFSEAELSGPERRRSKRVALALQIQVSGRDAGGAEFREQTVTADINEHGCRFNLSRQLHPGTAVTIELGAKPETSPANGRHEAFKIVWAVRLERDWSFGAAQVQSEPFWPITYHHRKETA